MASFIWKGAGCSIWGLLILSNTLFFNSSPAEFLKLGLNSSMFSKISRMAGVVNGNSFLNSILQALGRRVLMYSKADGSETKLVSWESWSPRISRITFSWSFLETMFFFWLLELFILSHGERGKQEVPVNRNLSWGLTPLALYCSVHEIISDKMQPVLQTSTAEL